MGACTVYCRLTSSPTGEIGAPSPLQPVTVESERPADGLQFNAVSLAGQALSASKQAASIAEELESIKADVDDDPLPPGLVLSLWLTLTSLIHFFPFIR